ncbi:MAG: hypothetical protein QXI58_04215 [Candidatus Micrarchaeia archaeon]
MQINGKEYIIDYIKDEELREIGVKKEFDEYLEQVRKETRERNNKLLEKVNEIENEIYNIKKKVK